MAYVIVSPVWMYSGGGGGYYGLVVVTSPRQQTLHRLCNDYLQNPYRIDSIVYMSINIGKRIAGKQNGPSLIIYGTPSPPPPPPPNNQMFRIGAHIWKTGGYFVPLLYMCLLCDEVLLPWNFFLKLVFNCFPLLFICLHWGGRRSPAVACWASDHWVASSNPLRGKFRH